MSNVDAWTAADRLAAAYALVIGARAALTASGLPAAEVDFANADLLDIENLFELLQVEPHAVTAGSMPTAAVDRAIALLEAPNLTGVAGPILDALRGLHRRLP